MLGLAEEITPAAIEYEVGSLRYQGELTKVDVEHDKEQLMRALKALLRVLVRALKSRYHMDTAHALLSEVLKVYDEEMVEC